MMISSERLSELPTLFGFHFKEHEILSLHFLKAIAKRLPFKLKLQKATIHLIASESFAVIGFRRSQKHIFIEFYGEADLVNERIVRTVQARNGRKLHRINVSKKSDIDSQLIEFVIHSSESLL